MADKQPARGRALNDGMTNDTWQRRRREDLAGLETNLDSSPTAKKVVGTAGFVAGLPVGAARGVWHLGKGAWDGLNFGVRLIDPLDSIYSPEGEAAWDKVADAGAAAYLYGRKVVEDPTVIRRDAESALDHFNKSNNPLATPMAPTVRDEWQRSTGIGANAGETAFDIATLVDGGLAVKGLTGFGKIPPLPDSAYLAARLSKRQLADLNLPYTRVGHHSVAQRWTKDLPSVIRDNPLFVVKPPGITKREFYELHYGVDQRFKGGSLKTDRRGATGLSGEKVGMQRYNAVDRIAFGTPYPLQVAGATGGAITVLRPFTYGPSNEPQRTSNTSGVPIRYSR